MKAGLFVFNKNTGDPRFAIVAKSDIRHRTVEVDNGYLRPDKQGFPVINLPSGEVFVVRYVITIISCFVLSLGLLAWNVGRNMGTDAEGQYGYDRALVRMLPTFCWTIVIAALVSVMVGWSSGLLELRSWIGWARLPLWTALSLFLGVFLQLIVADQGR